MMRYKNKITGAVLEPRSGIVADMMAKDDNYIALDAPAVTPATPPAIDPPPGTQLPGVDVQDPIVKDTPTAAPEDSAAAIDEMKRPELFEIAKKLGVALPGNVANDALRQAIKAAYQADAAAAIKAVMEGGDQSD